MPCRNRVYNYQNIQLSQGTAGYIIQKSYNKVGDIYLTPPQLEVREGKMLNKLNDSNLTYR